MTTINSSTYARQVRFAKETVAWDTPSSGAGQILRILTSKLDRATDTLKTNEIRPSKQMLVPRQGISRVVADFTGELSPGTYSLFLAAACRKDFATGATMTATTISSSASSPHFSDSANGFITGGFKIGDIVRVSGFTSTGAANNGRNYIISALSAGTMTVLDLGATVGTVATMTAGDSVTIAVYGKKTFAALSSQTDDSFTYEHWFSDITESEYGSGCKVDTLGLTFQPGQMAQIAVGMKGGTFHDGGTSAFFSSPSAVTNSNVLSPVQGGLLIAGNVSQYCTGLTVNLAGNMGDTPTIGSQNIQEVVQGALGVSGQITAYFDSDTLRDYFLNESDVSIVYYMRTAKTNAADFVQVCMPLVHFYGASKAAGAGGFIQTIPFTAGENVNGGSGTSSEWTTISFQDSLAS